MGEKTFLSALGRNLGKYFYLRRGFCCLELLGKNSKISICTQKKNISICESATVYGSGLRVYCSQEWEALKGLHIEFIEGELQGFCFSVHRPLQDILRPLTGYPGHLSIFLDLTWCLWETTCL